MLSGHLSAWLCLAIKEQALWMRTEVCSKFWLISPVDQIDASPQSLVMTLQSLERVTYALCACSPRTTVVEALVFSCQMHFNKSSSSLALRAYMSGCEWPSNSKSSGCVLDRMSM